MTDKFTNEDIIRGLKHYTTPLTPYEKQVTIDCLETTALSLKNYCKLIGSEYLEKQVEDIYFIIGKIQVL